MVQARNVIEVACTCVKSVASRDQNRQHVSAVRCGCVVDVNLELELELENGSSSIEWRPRHHSLGILNTVT
jgi:hypothetical protein